MSAPRPTGCGPARERPGARPAMRSFHARRSAHPVSPDTGAQGHGFLRAWSMSNICPIAFLATSAACVELGAGAADALGHGRPEEALRVGGRIPAHVLRDPVDVGRQRAVAVDGHRRQAALEHVAGHLGGSDASMRTLRSGVTHASSAVSTPSNRPAGVMRSVSGGGTGMRPGQPLTSTRTALPACARRRSTAGGQPVSTWLANSTMRLRTAGSQRSWKGKSIRRL